MNAITVKTKYLIEKYGGGFVVIDTSGNRGQFGESYAGKEHEWQDQPLDLIPFPSEEAARDWANELN